MMMMSRGMDVLLLGVTSESEDRSLVPAVSAATTGGQETCYTPSQRVQQTTTHRVRDSGGKELMTRASRVFNGLVVMAKVDSGHVLTAITSFMTVYRRMRQKTGSEPQLILSLGHRHRVWFWMQNQEFFSAVAARNGV